MNAKEIEQGIIKEMVKPLFKKHQFNVAGKTFLKGEADFVKVFNIQSSAWNQKDSVKFTFNIGFFCLIHTSFGGKRLFPSISRNMIVFSASDQDRSSKAVVVIIGIQ
ncbi:DUF4304 domain-containing protein [Rhodocytophaga aerolata]|uniref:DUF4304 domain-containing protein n=1 Tax=Rhodocytophaga aerolata TaxID=455078 RepID=A0ABT8RHT9_9BACT|nr:DUF4304 domain-containing protein [Rhodocytophaga aerolata]MDO1451672.1 DUF4304 domain-containing protein [Rhodocytophaga aerolata]